MTKGKLGGDINWIHNMHGVVQAALHDLGLYCQDPQRKEALTGRLDRLRQQAEQNLSKADAKDLRKQIADIVKQWTAPPQVHAEEFYKDMCTKAIRFNWVTYLQL